MIFKVSCDKKKKTSYYTLLNLYWLNFVFSHFLRCNPRWAPIVYRLIGAALMGIFLHSPFLFQNRNFGLTYLIWHARQFRVKSCLTPLVLNLQVLRVLSALFPHRNPLRRPPGLPPPVHGVHPVLCGVRVRHDFGLLQLCAAEGTNQPTHVLHRR